MNCSLLLQNSGQFFAFWCQKATFFRSVPIGLRWSLLARYCGDNSEAVTPSCPGIERAVVEESL